MPASWGGAILGVTSPFRDKAKLEGLEATLTKLRIDFQTREAKLRATVDRQAETIRVLGDVRMRG